MRGGKFLGPQSKFMGRRDQNKMKFGDMIDNFKDKKQTYITHSSHQSFQIRMEEISLTAKPIEFSSSSNVMPSSNVTPQGLSKKVLKVNMGHLQMPSH